LPLAFTLVSCSACSLTLKMEAICSTEMSVDFHWTTQRYIPEDSTHHNHHCENLKKFTSVPSEVQCEGYSAFSTHFIVGILTYPSEVLWNCRTKGISSGTLCYWF
jgi:hypothetical protein